MTTGPGQEAQRADNRRIDVGKIGVSSHTVAELLDEFRTMLTDKSSSPRVINCVNAHIFNEAMADPRLQECLRDSRIVAADGFSVVLAARLFGGHVRERCNMTEAFRAFIEDRTMPANSAVLVGCSLPEAESAAEHINRRGGHCRVIRAVSGFLGDEECVSQIQACRDVDLVLLGMGTPKSERIARLISLSCPDVVIWHIGGGTIRFLAGTQKEAPAFFRRHGLQWLFRLCLEPRRMWRRYLLGIPLFIASVAWQRFRAAPAGDAQRQRPVGWSSFAATAVLVLSWMT